MNADRLIRSLGATVADLEELLRATAGSANEAVVAARRHIEDSLCVMKRRLRRIERRVMRRAKRVVSPSAPFSREGWKLMGIAGGAGVLVGLILSELRPRHERHRKD